jgi:hypothetical protein
MFEAGTLAVGKLVADLEALSASLVDADPKFVIAFERAWGKLEDAYAMMRFGERSTPNQQEAAVIQRGIAELRFLLTTTDLG